MYFYNKFIIKFVTDAVCNDLPETNNLEIIYTPPREVSANLSPGQRYTGTIATYSCSPGYQLVGGSSLRACGQDGSWKGTQPFCAGVCKICIVHYSIASRVQTMR